MTTNEKPGFTPGPWTPEGFDDWGDGTNLPLELDVRVNGSRWDKIVDSIRISDANAHIIAAAPDLYEALNELLDISKYAEWNDGGDRLDAALEAGLAALAKARGEA